MKDYSAMSYFEINKAIDDILYPPRPRHCKAYNRNYCNKPADAYPIILSNKISINHWRTGEWTADAIDGDFVFSDTPLRAAMIVYLQMMEAKA